MDAAKPNAGGGFLLLCAGGIIGGLALYGFLQERIMAMPYGEDEYFKDSVFLVLNNRVVAMIAGLVMVFVKGESLIGGPPKYLYLIVACSNIAATTCQYEALKYVSFPTQTLGKTMKMVPTMVMSKLIGMYYGTPKTYKWVEWLISSAVTSGCLIFLLTGNISSKRSKKGGEDSLFGLLLMVGYLGFDAFTPVMQERLFQTKKYGKASRNAAMFYTNASSAIMSTVYLASTGTLERSIGFVQRNPPFLFDATLLSMSTTVSQFAIYATVGNFGALILAAIMNVRQLIQVILSMVMYQHTPTAGQVAGLAMVFSALFWQGHLKSQSAKAKDKKKE